MDAVQAAVISLEDNELFNAGKGSAFTSEETHELEASIMCGKRVDGGAACGLKNIKIPSCWQEVCWKNPIICF